MIFQLSSSHRSQAIIALWIILCLILVLYLSYYLKVRSDISFFLPEDQNAVDSVMKHQLTQGEAGKIILIALSEKNDQSSTQPYKNLANFNKKLTARLKKNKAFISVQNGSLSLSDLLIEPYYKYRYLLQSQSEPDFSIVSLSHSFEQLLQQLQLMPSPLEQKLFSEDPQMRWLNLLKQWQTQKLQKQQGVWFDQQGKQSLLFVKTQAEAYDLNQQKNNIESIESSIHQLIQENDSLSYALTGAPVFALASKKSISTQIKSISVIASFILMAFLFWFFRSVKILILIGLPLGFAVLTGMTSVILFDGFIHGITIAFGITIIGIAVDYPVHLYSHIIFSSGKKHSQSLIMQSIWPLLRLGLITTLIGFSAITLSDFSGLRQLGIFAISGLLGAAAVTRFLLPQFPVTNHNVKHLANHSSSYKAFAILVNYPLPKITYPLSIILPCIALLYIISQQATLWQTDLSAMSPVPQAQKQLDFELRKAMGLPELRYALIIQGNTIEQVLQQSESIKPALEQLKQQGIISGYDMASHYLPSIQFQTEQQSKLPDARQLKKRIETVLQNSPLSVDAFLPFLQSVQYSKQTQVLTRQVLLGKNESEGNDKIHLRNDFITDKIKILLFLSSDKKSTKKWTALIPLQGVQHGLTIQPFTKQFDFSVHLLDLKTQTESMLINYRNDALLWFFLGSTLIFTVLLLQNQSHQISQKQRMLTLFSLAWPFSGAVILTIASLIVMGYSLSIFHLVTLLLVIGLGIDYSVFMLLPRQGSNELNQSPEVAQVSVIICLISTLIMFGALSLSDLPVLKAIGLTASLGALYSFILARTFVNKKP